MIAIGCDHGGFELKQHVIKHLEEKGVEVKDYGTYTEDSVDYPDCARPVCKAVLSGISIAANKFNGIRAALCGDVYSATMARQHNDANIICLGGRVLGRELAFMIVDAWLDNEHLGGRHSARVAKIHEIEKNQ